MNKELSKIRKFTDLDAWKEGHRLVMKIYKVTKDFPKEERYGLVSQMTRCAVSITSNIAEGFSRFSYKDKTRFYYVALGSVTELQNQLLVSRDVEYLSHDKFTELANQSVKVHKIINGLIKRSKIHYS